MATIVETAARERATKPEQSRPGSSPSAVEAKGQSAGERSRLSFFRYQHRGRSLPLDMLRGIAILLVLGRHYVVEPVNLGVVQPIASAWTHVGWAGVDLFFVLSGFLVSGLLFTEFKQREAVDIRRFVIRRGFKIWPSYIVYVAFVAFWLLAVKRYSPSSVMSELWPNLLHVQNYFHTPRVHTWSLAVEEHFYLAVALVFFLFLRGPIARTFLRCLPAATVALVALVAFFRYVAYQHAGPDLNLYATHLRFDGLLIGTLVAYLTHFESDRLRRFAKYPLTLIAFGVALALPTLILTPETNAWTESVGLSAMYLGFALFLIGWLNIGEYHELWRRSLSTPAAAWLGQVGFYSYSIYLWHVDLAQTPVKKIAQIVSVHQLPPGLLWMGTTFVYVSAAAILGGIASRVVELPSLVLRDRLFPKRDHANGKQLASSEPPESVDPTEERRITGDAPHSAPETAAAG